MDRSDQMAILVFAVNTFPLELAWYSEVCLFKELTWDWILRLQERGAGPCVDPLSRRGGGGVPLGDRPSPALLPLLLHGPAVDCYRGRRRCDCLKLTTAAGRSVPFEH